MTWSRPRNATLRAMDMGSPLCLAVTGLIGTGLATAQTTAQEKPLLAEEVFKNVQVLKGFLSTISSRRWGS